MKNKVKHPSNFKDLTSKVFNYLIVIKIDRIENWITYWLCKCICGNLTSVRSAALNNGSTKSCGCLRKINLHNLRFKDLTGQVFERLTVEKFDRVEKRTTYWVCKCVCGKIVSINGAALTGGKTKSCGCLRDEQCSITGKKAKTHGMKGTSFYDIWGHMKQRCYNPKNKAYLDYGGRGIKVCDKWLESFENFKEDMYLSYLEHGKIYGFGFNTSLDRIDVMGNYTPDNCRWSTSEGQSNNRRTSSQTDNYAEHKYWRKRLYCNLYAAIRNGYLTSKILEPYLGCSLSYFRKHIESQFKDGMSWDNYGKGVGKWQLDHIIGCNNFDLSKEKDRLVCFNYKNYQPLTTESHNKKSKKVLIYA